LGPVHDIGRQTGGILADRLASGATRDAIFTAFLDELVAPDLPRPVIVVEDAHWADEATLDWLVFLGRRLERLPALLVITYRDDEVGPDHPLRGVLASLPTALLDRVPLAPLSRSLVAEQARRAGRDPAAVHRLAGGNPLLVTELLKSPADTVPVAVQDLVLERLRRLPAEARDLAQLVSVVPTRADPAVVGTSEAVDSALAAGVLVPAGDGLAFRHELLRGAVENSLSPARRALLHRRVLELLTGAGGVDPGRLVHHARLADDHDAVLQWAQVAGADAARQGAHREAAAHYRAAASLADRLPDPDRAEILEAYAGEAALAGYYEDALTSRETAVLLRERLGQLELVGRNLRAVSELSWWTGRTEQAHTAARRAVAVLEGLPESHELAQAYNNQAQVLLAVHDFDQVSGWTEKARVLAERLGDDGTALLARINQTSVAYCLGEAGAREAMEELVDRTQADGRIDDAARVMLNLFWITADELAQYRAAEPLAERALAFAEEHDLVGIAQMVRGARAKLRLERGDWEGAVADAGQVLAESGLGVVNAVLPLVVQGRVQSARGDSGALDDLERASEAAAGAGDIALLSVVADARAEYFLWDDEAERAANEARRGLEVAGGEQGLPLVAGKFAYRLWQSGAPDAVPACTAAEFRHVMDGDWAAAADAWDLRGGTLLRAEALGEGDETAVAEAFAVLNGLGAVRAAEHLRGRLRRRGVTRVPRGPRRATAANPAGLTRRQADVLALLCDGLSNAEIARRLVVSSKTVDHHVSAVLTKLGASNREQAAAVARRLGLG
jgi:DNA-binding CsgD family transcriptional regulator/tetratricopeptide (TPR) repeat protein